MGAVVLKSHHPCFLVYFELGRADDGFQPPGGFFCPFRFGDIFFAPRDGSYALPHSGIHHNNMPVLSSSFGKCKIENRTIDSE